MLTSKELTDVLRANGHKVTPQRIAIYEYLSQVTTHPTADTIFKKLHPRYEGLSLGTVYKTLDIFTKLYLIRALNTGEDSFRYDADTSDHQHIQCSCCGRVDDIALGSLDIRKKVEGASGYQVHGSELYFYGVCPDCQAKKVTQH
jgi:Fur family peroxide stress response transcriptional regulator